MRIYATGLTVRRPWVPVWLAIDAVVFAVTVLAGLGVPEPPWVLAVLWVIAIAATAGLLVFPPPLAREYRPGAGNRGG